MRRRELLEHSVVVRSFLRDRLNDVPVLNHFAVLKLVDIHNCESWRTGLAHGMIVDDHVVAIGEDVLDLGVIVRKFVLQERNVAFETLWPIGSVGIVLFVGRGISRPR